MTRGNRPVPAIERILRRLAIPDDPAACWLWPGSLNTEGYGQIQTGSRSDGTRRPDRVHRVIYEALVGTIPEGLEIDHRCHNDAVVRSECSGGATCPHRRCCNPRHLETVTRQANILRGLVPITNGRWQRAKTRCPAGHPYDEANTRIWHGKRSCRACKITGDRRRRRVAGTRRRYPLGITDVDERVAWDERRASQW